MQKKILKHKAVEELYKDNDGWWIVLKDGYEWYGCASIHEYTLARCWEALQSITIV